MADLRTSTPQNNVRNLVDSEKPTTTIVAAGQIWDVYPEYARGTRGQSMTVEFKDGREPFHSTNVWHRAVAPQGAKEQAVLWKDPVRERLGPAYQRNDGTYSLPERVLVQPMPLGMQSPGTVINYDSESARAFLRREIEQKYAQTVPHEHRTKEQPPRLIDGPIIASNECFVVQRDEATQRTYILELNHGTKVNQTDLAGAVAITAEIGIRGKYEVLKRGLAHSERPQGRVGFVEAAETRKAVAGIVFADGNGDMHLLDERDQKQYPIPGSARSIMGHAVVAVYATKTNPTYERETRVYPIMHKHLGAVSEKLQKDTELWHSANGIEPKTVGAILLPEADLGQARAILAELEHTGNKLHAYNVIALGKHGDHLVVGTDQTQVAQRMHVAENDVTDLGAVRASQLYELSDGKIEEAIAEINLERKTFEPEIEKDRPAEKIVKLDTSGRSRNDHTSGRTMKRSHN